MEDNYRALTFPSSRTTDIFIKILNYVKEYNILEKGSIVFNEEYMNYLGIDSLSDSTLNNSIEWFEFFKLVKQGENISEYIITDTGKELFKYYNEQGKFNSDIILNMLLDVTLPYKPRCIYNLKDREYHVFETMLKVFLHLDENNHKLLCKQFDEVFYFKINDNNYKNYEEISELILETKTFKHKNRPIIDYLFAMLEFFGVIDKVESYIYVLNEDFKKLIKEKYDELDPVKVAKIILKNENFERIEEIVEDDNLQQEIETAKEYDEASLLAASNRKPELSSTSSVKRYKVDARISKTVLAKKNYKCEYATLLGKKHPTFNNKKGVQYQEGHHLIPIKAQKDFEINIDRPENIVCLCPVCHRRVHNAIKKERVDILKKLYDSRISSLKSVGIDISFEDLFNKYYS